METPIRDAMEAYLQDRHYAGVTDNTVKSYRAGLARLLDYCEGKGVTTLARLTENHVKAALDTPDRAPGTRRQWALTVRGFLKYAVKRWTVAADPAEIPLPRIQARIPDILTVKEIGALLKTCGRSKNGRRIDKRDRLMLCLLAECGLRASELLSLRLCDIAQHDGEAGVRGSLHIRGKGGKERRVAFTEDTRRAFAAHLTAWPITAEDSYLFPSQVSKEKPMLPSGLWRMVNRRAKRAGITRPIWPHMFRHTFATRVQQTGGDVYLTARALGHSQVRSTMVYLHYAQPQVDQAVSAASVLSEVQSGRKPWEL